ncbi:Fur family transcriptional regulator [Patulibacter sp. SYSU D01012]|uniref:Fur family transcriptional regulator n=1 Tax=Patulibacter sp. SYSU D01012 TaxID=2817381 RepID=UPI001B304D09|nr:Fur family transcriptional regulator [Patulibacter sp. SYSU D01012]
MDAVAPTAEVDARLVARLRGAGLRVTPQRLALHRIVAATPRHVTAEALLREATADLPGLALPTVYSTLELFAELGVVRRVAAPGAARYDTDPTPHDHFTCTRCGTLLDLDTSAGRAAATRAAEAAGHRVASATVVVTGVCAGCAADA